MNFISAPPCGNQPRLKFVAASKPRKVSINGTERDGRSIVPPPGWMKSTAFPPAEASRGVRWLVSKKDLRGCAVVSAFQRLVALPPEKGSIVTAAFLMASPHRLEAGSVLPADGLDEGVVV